MVVWDCGVSQSRYLRGNAPGGMSECGRRQATDVEEIGGDGDDDDQPCAPARWRPGRSGECCKRGNRSERREEADDDSEW